MSSGDESMEKRQISRAAKGQTSNNGGGNSGQIQKKTESYPFVNKSARYRREPNLPNAVSAAVLGGSSASQVGVQKSKSLSDKRPLPRSFSGPGTRNRGQIAKGDAAAELGSVSRPGSKKAGALNDYLNFSYDSFTWQNRNRSQPQRYNRYRTTSANYNKEQYLQANCQFVLIDGPNYKEHLLDPDLLVEWENVEELRIIGSEVGSCPICLYPPVAAKITKCGHVYCWPCLLHYLALSDKQWRKCPICFESVYGNQLKSVVSIQVDKHEVGGLLNMTLMRRERGSTVALPKNQWGLHHEEIRHLSDHDSRFAKLLVVSAAEARQTIISRERKELENKWSDDKDTPESVFILEALKHIEKREAQLIDREEIETSLPIKVEQRRSVSPKEKTSPAVPKPIVNENVEFFIDPFNDVWKEQSNENDRTSDDSGTSPDKDGLQTIVDEDLGVDALTELTLKEATQCSDELLASPNCTKSCYFYQADDGQSIFVHPLNARCLVYEYGSLAEAPETIGGRILQLENVVMTEDLRQRFRYLSHLPLTTNFVLAELKFDRDILSRATISHFADEFVRRQRARQKRAREEERRERNAKQWERVLLMEPSKYSPVASQSGALPPELPVLRYVASAQADIASGIVDTPTQNITTDVNGEEQQQRSSIETVPSGSSPPSFAEMLRLGKPKAPVAQPQPQIVSSSKPIAKTGSDDEESMPAPSYQNTFGEALQMAFESLDSYQQEENEKPENDQSTDGQKQQKKKGKYKHKKTKKILFSTGTAAPAFH